MKMLVCGLAASFGALASSVSAEVMLNVDGEIYSLSTLMEHCQGMADEPMEQINCFTAVSKLVDEQTGDGTVSVASVPDALNALRAAAQYETDETGLIISGTECNVEILYYGNYFHISRRNVSSIDLFHAEFDASHFEYDQISQVPGAQVPLSRGMMDDSATATARGGVALESTQFNFDPKSARGTIGDYAVEVVPQLPATQGRQVDFVLVHPAKGQASAEIWTAFEAYVDACHG